MHSPWFPYVLICGNSTWVCNCTSHGGRLTFRHLSCWDNYKGNGASDTGRNTLIVHWGCRKINKSDAQKINVPKIQNEWYKYFWSLTLTFFSGILEKKNSVPCLYCPLASEWVECLRGKLFHESKTPSSPCESLLSNLLSWSWLLIWLRCVNTEHTVLGFGTQ